MSKYLRPIEMSGSNIDGINIDPGNIIFDIAKMVLYYDTGAYARISFADIIFYSTESEKEQHIGLPGKIYIVLENATPYIYNGGWIPIQCKPEESFSIFYLDPLGSDNNSGVSVDLAVLSFSKIFSTHSANKDYYIIASSGNTAYNFGTTVYNKNSIRILCNGDSPAAVTGPMNFEGISNLYLSNLEISGGVSLKNCTVTIENCIFKNGGISLDNSKVIISNSTISNITDNAIHATNSAYITCVGVTGSSINCGYKASNGGVINVVGNKLTCSTETSIDTTGRVYFEGESVDKSTKEYVESLLTIKEV